MSQGGILKVSCASKYAQSPDHEVQLMSSKPRTTSDTLTMMHVLSPDHEAQVLSSKPHTTNDTRKFMQKYKLTMHAQF